MTTSTDSGGQALRPGRVRRGLVVACSLVLPLFTLFEVNYPRLAPHSALALFALFGLVLVFLEERPGAGRSSRATDLPLALLSAAVCLYVVVQTEPLFRSWWQGGASLGDRAGMEGPSDFAVGVLGLVLVLLATYRSLGIALPALSGAFLLYAGFGYLLPDWLLPHRGYGLERIVSQTFLHSQGVFGVALSVMFSYVFLFVIFGSVLEITGATDYVVGAGRRLFGRAVGGPAKVAVFSSGLLGSLSGSAVANTATTGTFTIPMMRSAGFRPHLAAGIEAAASSGGALVPPVMGAGAYMMLEMVDPPVTYLEIIRAAILPSCLYYLAIFLTVHFFALKLDVGAGERPRERPPLWRYEGVIVSGALGCLVGLLVAGFSVFRAVTVSLFLVLALAVLHRRTRPSWRGLLAAMISGSRAGTPLITAAACVGVIIGVVTLTGAGTRLPALILPLAQHHLLPALLLIMTSSIILGMGLPSAVCYLLLATLIGPALGGLGVPPLAAHFFIFYFGLMSMVTPPVALAAYAASSIANSKILQSSVAAFRFALVGFALPFMFVYRPELLILDPDGGTAGLLQVAPPLVLAAIGVVPLAAAVAGYLRRPLGVAERLLMVLSAAMTLYPGGIFPERFGISLLNLAGVALFGVLLLLGRPAGRAPATVEAEQGRPGPGPIERDPFTR